MSLLTDLPDLWFDDAMASLALPYQPLISRLPLQIYLIDLHTQDRRSCAEVPVMKEYELDIQSLKSFTALDLDQLLDALLPSLSGLSSRVTIAKDECFADLGVSSLNVGKLFS